jgi:uncharacterized delta-60 repeat protein
LEDRTSPSAGMLDPTFGVGGVVITPVPSFLSVPLQASQDFEPDASQQIAIQPDGKIIRAGDSVQLGETSTGALAFFAAVTRYTINGTVDASFGASGPTPGFVGQVFAGPPTPNGPSYNTGFGEMALQTDGKTILTLSEFAVGLHRNVVARLNIDGTLDSTFGTNGQVFFDRLDTGNGDESLAIQGDGKIVLAGGFHSPTGDRFALARLNADGTVDSSFGNSGTQTIDFGSVTDDGLGPVKIQSDGKIVMGGWVGVPDGNVGSYALARLNSDGSLDTSFGPDHDGKLITPPLAGADATSGFWDLALQPDGKIIGVGDDDINGANVATVVRLNSDGSPDTSFGTAGRQTWGGVYAYNVAVAPDGKIDVAGVETAPGGVSAPFAVARLNSDGSLDDSFGTAGTTFFASSINDPVDMAIQADGNIVVAGTWGGLPPTASS